MEESLVQAVDRGVQTQQQRTNRIAYPLPAAGQTACNFWSPLETAHFAAMSPHLRNTVLRNADVRVPDLAAPAAAREDRAGPAQTRDATRVTRHGPDELARRDVVDLDRTGRESDGEVRPIFGELDAADVLVAFEEDARIAVADLTQLGDGPGLGVPDVDDFCERDREQVGRRPVEQVEVVVVLWAGGRRRPKGRRDQLNGATGVILERQ